MSIFFDTNFPVIELNDDYQLREHDIKDIDAFYEYYSNPNVSRHILASKPQSRTDAESEIHYCRNLYRFKRGIYWTIAKRDTDTMIGAIGITCNNFNLRGEIHYDLAESFWNKGIMSQAIATVVDYAFSTMQMIRIEAITMPENLASQRVLVKNKFQHEGMLRNYKFFNNKRLNIDLFATIPDDWN